MNLWTALKGDAEKEYDFSKQPLYDRWFFVITLLLLAFGVTMIYSASIEVAEKKYGDEMYFLYRQIAYIGISGVISIFAISIPTSLWYKLSKNILIWGAVLLCAITLFAGRDINGAKRWIPLLFVNFQSSELFKLIWVMYISGYLYRHYHQLQSFFVFSKPFIIYLITVLILYFQKDYGSTVVVSAILLALLVIGGARVFHILFIIVLFVALGAFYILSEPYRIGRITSFTDPFKEQFGKGAQLSNSLMALGNGDISGVGLGNSVFKLEYLPEAHTDFIMAIIGEELGIVGILTVLFLEIFLITKCFLLGKECLKSKYNKNEFTGFCCFGFGTWLFLQVFINVGSISGLIPPKGLTLPFVSFGGSSLMMMIVAISILTRISFERRVDYLNMVQAKKRHNRFMSNKKKDTKDSTNENTSNEMSIEEVSKDKNDTHSKDNEQKEKKEKTKKTKNKNEDMKESVLNEIDKNIDK